MRLSKPGVALSAATAVTALTVSAGGVIASEQAPAHSPTLTPLTTVTDDTGTISLDVPEDWVVETSPAYYHGFYEVVPVGHYPTIKAHPGGADAVFGTRLTAQAFPVSPHGDVVDSFYGDYGVACDPSSFKPEMPFDSGVLSGEQHDAVGCHDVARHTIVADHGPNFTVAVDASSQTEADEAVIAGLLGSIQPVSDAPITGPVTEDPGSPGSDTPGSDTPEPPSGDLPPAEPGDGVETFWPYGEFWNVPQLGTEPVRGSGCGGSAQIGDRIPDGLWAGNVAVDPATPDEVWVNLLCIYYGESAQAVRDAGTASIIHDEPDYLIVDNNEQDRVLTNNITAIAVSAPDDSGRCLPNDAVMPGADGWDAAGLQAWIRVSDGAVTWLVYGCDTDYTPGS